MLNQAFWRNGAWLLRFQLRSKLRVEVCYIQQYCALKKEKCVDDYKSLAVSAETEADGGVSREAELSYFAPEAVILQERPQSKHMGKPPLRKTLSYTNKMLYGPLLETAAEKRRRIKAEEGEDESTQRTRKRKKGQKKKPPEIVEPLLWKPENAHLQGLFPVSGPKYVDKVQVCKVEVKQDSETGGFSVTRKKKPKSKMLVFNKSSNNSLKFDRSLLKDAPTVQKLYVASWHEEKEVTVFSGTDRDTPDKINVTSGGQGKESNVSSSTYENTPPEEGSQANEADVPSEDILENNVSENNFGGNTAMACSDSDVNDKTLACSPSDLKGDTTACRSSDLKSEKDQGIQALESYRETSSLLHVDNAKFSSAPSVIDAAMIENFPLERTDVQGVQHKTPVNVGDTGDNIFTIGMFDRGYQRLPSVSKILEATMSEENRRVLERWKAKMIKQLGEEGFEEYRKELFDKGKLLHGCIHSELTGVSPGVENLPSVQGVWTSISHVLPSITNVSVLESRLVHPYLHYQGAVDCVATYKGMPVLIDWKTSTKPKLTLNSMFDNPLQVAAYLGALNYDSNYQLPQQVESAMVVVAYDSGLPAHVHILDKEKCQTYWRLWCARLLQFWRQLQIREPTGSV